MLLATLITPAFARQTPQFLILEETEARLTVFMHDQACLRKKRSPADRPLWLGDSLAAAKRVGGPRHTGGRVSRWDVRKRTKRAHNTSPRVVVLALT